MKMDSIQLSHFTKVDFMDKDSIQLSRVCTIGDDFSKGYRILISYNALKALVVKRQNIGETMAAITKGKLDSPQIITLDDNHLLRLSFFYGDIYYGFQYLYTANQPKKGSGNNCINLTEGEYKSFVVFLEDKLLSLPLPSSADNGLSQSQ
jgi:hypothetical protein